MTMVRGGGGHISSLDPMVCFFSSLLQLAGPDRPQRRGPRGEQDGHRDPGAEGHGSVSTSRWHQPAWALDVSGGVGQGYGPALPRLHERYSLKSTGMFCCITGTLTQNNVKTESSIIFSCIYMLMMITDYIIGSIFI